MTFYSKNNLSFTASSWRYMAFLAFAVVIISLPELSFAGNTAGGSKTGISNVICNIVGELQGPVARGIAAFAIILLGFSLFLGKISWGTALALGIGIGAVFGAEQLVQLISGSETGNANTC